MPLFRFGAALLVVFALSRALLVLAYLGRLRQVDGALWCFPVGLRMDLIVVCYVLALPVMASLLLPGTWLRRVCGALAAYCAAWAMVVVYMEAATLPFVAQYDRRPDRLFFEYLVHPREVLGLLLAEYKLPLVLSLVLAAAAFEGTRPWVRRGLSAASEWPRSRRLLAAPLTLVLLFLGARSSLRHRGANISTASFSSDHLTNECALNSTYSLAYAIYSLRHEEDPSRFYGSMPTHEVLNRVRRYTGAPADAFGNPEIPLLHPQASRLRRGRPLNLVVFLQESLGAEYVPCLGGMPLTPKLCELAEEGVLLTQLYATGTRTVRGIEAVASGFLPTPGRSVVKLGKSQHDFFTLGALLARHGYATEFVYGGESNFDTMRSFLVGNGFQQVWDETTFRDPVFRGNWGVSDEDLVREANASFRSKGDTPFFALMLSTSNHSPFDFPAGRIELYEQPRKTVHNAMKYADFAIGELFRLARQEAYFADTLFLVIADHDTRVQGDDLVPIRKFRIPGVLVGPGVPRGVRLDDLASQIDIIPTLLGLLGLDVEHPVPGRDLLAEGDPTPARAVMQLGTLHAFRVGDHVVVRTPKATPGHFRYVDERLVPAAVDPELERDSLAHALLPGILYREGRHRLPAAP